MGISLILLTRAVYILFSLTNCVKERNYNLFSSVLCRYKRKVALLKATAVLVVKNAEI